MVRENEQNFLSCSLKLIETSLKFYNSPASINTKLKKYCETHHMPLILLFMSTIKKE